MDKKDILVTSYPKHVNSKYQNDPCKDHYKVGTQPDLSQAANLLLANWFPQYISIARVLRLWFHMDEGV